MKGVALSNAFAILYTHRIIRNSALMHKLHQSVADLVPLKVCLIKSIVVKGVETVVIIYGKYKIIIIAEIKIIVNKILALAELSFLNKRTDMIVQLVGDLTLLLIAYAVCSEEDL